MAKPALIAGADVLAWPELRAVCARLGVDGLEMTTALTLTVPCDGPARVQQEPPPPLPPWEVDGLEVYGWPEFAALSTRFGLPWDLPTTSVTLHVHLDRVVRITQEYLARDTSLDAPAPVPVAGRDRG
jgi:hypothetical protein